MKADVVIIGGGHAGCEAALSCARMGHKTVLCTLNIESIALMPCNPSIGGTGKGHLVREVDALGGEMGRVADDTLIQARMLNTGKGPAVHSLRAQQDKRNYQSRMLDVLFAQENLTVIQTECTEIVTKNAVVVGVKTAYGDTIDCRATILCAGVYLKSNIIIGSNIWHHGPQGLLPANQLSHSLVDLGFSLRRFKTGTPARVDVRSINFDKMEKQEGDTPIVPFSFMTEKQLENKVCCYLTWTNERTHDIIRNNLHKAPMYAGIVKGTGARYCPSIEDKVVRFADKDRHQLFLEPEGLHHPEWYVQGMSTGLPKDVQEQMYRSVAGLENAVLTRLAYAIEYDTLDSTALLPTLQSHQIKGFFSAGQINGTSGYEEAAAQGLLAGINASLYLKEEEPFILTREEAYIGVMADDLTTKGTDEPYRMMTSRAEHRLILRQDNADLRLTHRAYKIGLATDERMRLAERKANETEQLKQHIKDSRMDLALRQPNSEFTPLPEWGEFMPRSIEQAHLQIKYEGYLAKALAQVKKANAMQGHALPSDTDYLNMEGLRLEARQKLDKQRPLSLSQASRIPGVNPADIAVLMVYVKRKETLQ